MTNANPQPLPKLLPCPFCGTSSPKLFLYPGNKHGSGSGDIECVGCDAAISIGGDGDAGAEVVVAWNRRATLAAQGGQLSVEDEAHAKMLGEILNEYANGGFSMERAALLAGIAALRRAVGRG